MFTVVVFDKNVWTFVEKKGLNEFGAVLICRQSYVGGVLECTIKAQILRTSPLVREAF